MNILHLQYMHVPRCLLPPTLKEEFAEQMLILHEKTGASADAHHAQ
jgi:hypothetical protein